MWKIQYLNQPRNGHGTYPPPMLQRQSPSTISRVDPCLRKIVGMAYTTMQPPSHVKHWHLHCLKWTQTSTTASGRSNSKSTKSAKSWCRLMYQKLLNQQRKFSRSAHRVTITRRSLQRLVVTSFRRESANVGSSSGQEKSQQDNFDFTTWHSTQPATLLCRNARFTPRDFFELSPCFTR